MISHNDNISHSSCSTSASVREIVCSATYNEAEIQPASGQYLDRIGSDYINRLETVPVTPEAPWDQRGEILLRSWMDASKNSSTNHKRTGYRLKKLYRTLSIAVIILTGLVFLLTSLFPCGTSNNSFKYIQVFSSFLSLIVANLSSFYDYGPKYQSHFQYEGLYMRYYIDIEEILATDIDFRPPKDKTIVEFRERMGNLLTSAPEV